MDAGWAGAWIHAQLGELVGPGLIADDLVDNIPLIVKNLSKLKKQ